MAQKSTPPPGGPAEFRARADALVSQLTLEEKAALCSGKDFWSTKAIERLGIPSIFMTDGPHGVRKAEGTDFTNSVPATCFPTASALASSWDVELLRALGEALGKESQALGVQILLGPGVNMKRSPLCGRNFEYFSEDPRLAGRLAAAYVRGVQSQGVGTSVKHFAANNQEHERTTTSSNLDERTLHEIYLPAFEIAVREAQPWTVMCAYNKVNGTFASEHPQLLHDILKRRWGLQGFVVSDWGAVNERPRGLAAGLHLEMPSSLGVNDARLVEAVQKGALAEARLNEMVSELLAVILCAHARRRPVTCDFREHHALARRAAGESMVLLQNDGLLPLDPARPLKLALLGHFAEVARYQGAGSSQVRPTELANARAALLELTRGTWEVSYAPGYAPDGSADPQRVAQAAELARAADVAVVFVGLPDHYESEAFDRSSLELPQGHTELVEAVARVQSQTAVVLMNGSAVTLPWAARVNAILEAWLGGQAGGQAIADVLTGHVNPSGKLSETFPARLEDTPAFLDFPGQMGEARYGERVFIGYRYYDARRLAPAFPFGHGLSYTTFEYRRLELRQPSPAEVERGVLQVATFDLKNTGKRAGKEVAQLYVRETKSRVLRPEKELKHFAKPSLMPGESVRLSFELGARDFAYYDVRVHDWVIDAGRFEIWVGPSSRGPFLTASCELAVTRPYPPLTRESMLKELAEHPRGQQLFGELLERFVKQFTGNAEREHETLEQRKAREMAEAFLRDLPLWKLPSMSQGKFSEAELQQLLAALGA